MSFWRWPKSFLSQGQVILSRPVSADRFPQLTTRCFIYWWKKPSNSGLALPRHADDLSECSST